MRLCVGTSKGIIILDADREGAPLMVLADPSSIWCMAQDCRDPNVIYASSNAYMHIGGAPEASILSRSLDGGRTWTAIPARATHEQEIWAIATPPDSPDEVFIGTAHARLFKSVDRGRTFDECKRFLELPGRDRWTFPMPPHLPHVRAISFDPAKPSTMYLGVEEGGVIRSRDHAASFELLKRGVDPDVHSVAVDRHDSRILYATTGVGFYRSENAGASWRRTSAGLNRSYTVPLAAHPMIEGLVYTAAAAGPPPSWSAGPNGADARMFRSLDYGKTFDPIEAETGPMRGMVMRLLQSPMNADELFAVLSDGTVIRWRDYGESFVTLANKLPPAYDMVALP